MTRVPVKLGAFAGGLAVAFGAAFAVGAAADSATSEPAASHGASEQSPATAHSSQAAGQSAAASSLTGLTVTDAGYTLAPASAALPSGSRVPFQFSITRSQGGRLTDYRVTHEKKLHLIVVRRDLTGFQHVHPTLGADGTWSTRLDLTAAGTYRVFADFAPAGLGRTLTLGTDVSVGGEFRPTALPAPAATATVDGYETAVAGAPVAGRESELTFTVSRAGRPVADLQPYLGAFGHLVSLRPGDLAFLHTHPAQQARAGQHGGPQIRFAAVFPTPGTYRLFLDFQHGGAVRTAEFTITVDAAKGTEHAAPTTAPTGANPSHGGGHGG